MITSMVAVAGLLISGLAVTSETPIVPDVEPWVITMETVITEPMRVEVPIILLDGGSLVVSGVPDPGFEVAGHIWALGSSQVVFEDSVIQFLSTFHGQYSLVGAEQSRVEVRGCDYRVPAGVQHALISAGSAEMVVTDTDFGDVQLLSAETATLSAARLNGSFEVLVQHASRMNLQDIPRDPGEGRLWVWVEFGPGSEAVYTPPMPGFIESWSFPPAGSSGIPQVVRLDRCEAMLWPMLVREGSRLTLRNIAEDNWVVVGLHLLTDAAVNELHNQQYYADHELGLRDRELRLENASIDTWNLYPQSNARVVVWGSTVGEILSMGDAKVRVRHTTIDGTGGFLGARDRSHIEAEDCLITCTVEATQEATIELHSSRVDPYPQDPTGAWTRFGAYDAGRLLADQTPVQTLPVLGDQGLIAVSYIANPPDTPPGPGTSVELWGIAAQFSLSDALVPGTWRLETVTPWGGVQPIGAGEGNVEEEPLGTWRDADPLLSYRLRIVLTDRMGRELRGRLPVAVASPELPPASAPRR